MVVITARRSGSSRPSTRSRMPTPKSNPSSTKYPTHSAAMTRNQIVVSSMVSTSVREGERFVGLFGRIIGLDRSQARTDRPEHELHLDHGQDAVQHGEADQRGQYLGRRGAG